MITLPFPAKILWPNGRGHHMAKHREFQKHKLWAFNATRASKPAMAFGALTRLNFLITPKTANAIDLDNCVAAMKAYQDGIALALGVDDSTFETPVIVITEPRKPGAVEVSFG